MDGYLSVRSRDGGFARAIDADVGVLAPKEKKKAKSALFRGPPELVDEIDKAAKELGISRNEAMRQLLRYALDAHKKEQSKKRGAKEH